MQTPVNTQSDEEQLDMTVLLKLLSLIKIKTLLLFPPDQCLLSMLPLIQKPDSFNSFSSSPPSFPASSVKIAAHALFRLELTFLVPCLYDTIRLQKEASFICIAEY